MTINSIQKQNLLEKLPDQQLAQLAQGSSPNVNPQDAMMEMNRRGQMRKSQEMQKPRGFNKGGGVEKDEEEMTAYEREALRAAKAREAMLEKPLQYGLETLTAGRDLGAAALGAVSDSKLGQNYRRGAQMREQAAVDRRTEQALQQSRTPTDFQRAANPAGAATLAQATQQGAGGDLIDNRTPPQGLAQIADAVPPPQTSPKPNPTANIPAAGGAPAGQAPVGIAQAASQQALKGQDPMAGEREQVAEQTKALKAQTTVAYDKMLQTISDEKGRLKADVSGDNKVAIYKGLTEFGMNLLLGQGFAKAGAAGVKRIQDVLTADSEKREENMKRIFELGFKSMEVELLKAGATQAQVDKLYELAKDGEAARASMRKEAREDRELGIEEFKARSGAAVDAAQAEYYRASARKSDAESRAKPSDTTPSDALIKQNRDALDRDPAWAGKSTEERGAEALRRARLDMQRAAGGGGTGLDLSGLDAELARRGLTLAP